MYDDWDATRHWIYGTYRLVNHWHTSQFIMLRAGFIVVYNGPISSSFFFFVFLLLFAWIWIARYENACFSFPQTGFCVLIASQTQKKTLHTCTPNTYPFILMSRRRNAVSVHRCDRLMHPIYQRDILLFHRCSPPLTVHRAFAPLNMQTLKHPYKLNTRKWQTWVLAWYAGISGQRNAVQMLFPWDPYKIT